MLTWSGLLFDKQSVQQCKFNVLVPSFQTHFKENLLSFLECAWWKGKSEDLCCSKDIHVLEELLGPLIASKDECLFQSQV